MFLLLSFFPRMYHKIIFALQRSWFYFISDSSQIQRIWYRKLYTTMAGCVTFHNDYPYVHEFTRVVGRQVV